MSGSYIAKMLRAEANRSRQDDIAYRPQRSGDCFLLSIASATTKHRSQMLLLMYSPDMLWHPLRPPPCPPRY